MSGNITAKQGNELVEEAKQYTSRDYVQWLLDHEPEHFYEFLEEFQKVLGEEE